MIHPTFADPLESSLLAGRQGECVERGLDHTRRGGGAGPGVLPPGRGGGQGQADVGEVCLDHRPSGRHEMFICRGVGQTDHGARPLVNGGGGSRPLLRGEPRPLRTGGGPHFGWLQSC